MTTELRNATTDPNAERFWNALEAAMLAKTIEHAADLPPERRKALLGLWAKGAIDAAVARIQAVLGYGFQKRHEYGRTSPLLVYEDDFGLILYLSWSKNAQSPTINKLPIIITSKRNSSIWRCCS